MKRRASRKKRIGLALSGGGTRAIAFHCGVLRTLFDLDLFQNVKVISGVSGGGIAAGALAASGCSVQTVDKLQVFSRTASVFITSMLGGLLSPFSTRTEKLADALDKSLFGGTALGQVNSDARIYINATNLATGNLFMFACGAGRPAEIGEHEQGFVGRPDFSLARAAAASSAYPVAFAPLKLSPQEYPARPPIQYAALIDGGVYDNLGCNPLFGADLDLVLISDAGAPFRNSESPTESGVAAAKDTIDILMEQNRFLAFERLEFRWKAGAGPRPIWFSIDSAGASPPQDVLRASQIATSLSALPTNDVALLERHASLLLLSRLKRYAPELL